MSTRYQQINKLLEKQGGKCAYCKKRCSGILAGGPETHISQKLKSRLATIDHMIALSLGGENTQANKVAACYACNQQKTNKPLMQFLREMGLDKEPEWNIKRFQKPIYK